MKNRVFATLSCMTLFTAAAAFAQSNGLMHADIPFEFRVGNTTLPAGYYEVRTQFAPGILVIRCYECNAAALVMTATVEAREKRETGALVFNRHDGKYALANVWNPGNEGRKLLKTKADREWARDRSHPSETIALALR